MAKHKGDPLKDPKYLAAKARIAQGQQRHPHSQPQNQTAINQAAKLVKEVKKNADKQAADLPRWKAAEARRIKRENLYRVDRKIKAAVDAALTRGDVAAAQRVISHGRKNAERANRDRVCTKCQGSGEVRSWGKAAQCPKCDGTGKKKWYQ